MAGNPKKTSPSVASLAGKTLQNDGASKLQKSLAGSALAQAGTSKQTGGALETKASQALRKPTANDMVHTLAGSVVSQSNRKR